MITGASGLVGSHLLNKLDDWDVHVITRTELSPQSNLNQIIIDLSKDWSIDQLPEKVDVVIHLAQSAHFREFPDFAEDVFSVNTISTIKLLNYAKVCGASSFILASSGGIYGFGDGEFSENEPIYVKEDLGFYLGTKFCSEIIAENYSDFMSVNMLRFFFVYGPGQSENMLIPRLVQSVKDGRPITFQGKGGIKINPIYVGDAVDAIMQTLSLKESYKINVGGSEPMDLRTIGTIIGEQVGKEPVFESSSDEEPNHLLGDVEKMGKLLTAPKTSFEEGIKLYLASL